MTRLSRVLLVSLGLIVTGGVVGALVGAVVGYLTVAAWNGPNYTDPMFGAYFGAFLFGAPLGAVLLPVAGWTLMRRVALGRATLGTAVGTITGGVIGWYLPFGDKYLMEGNALVRVLVASIVGFLLAVIVLRRSAVVGDVGIVTSAGRARGAER